MSSIPTTSTGLLIAAAIALLLSYAITRWVQTKARLDQPNHRSSHTQPTPTGGGLGIALCSIVTLVVLGVQIGTSYLSAAVGVALLAATSWWDDTRPLSPLVRLAVQCAAACLACLPVLWLGAINGLWWLIVVLAVMWLINLYNFMDGTDGLAAVQGLLFTLGALLLIPRLQAPDQLLLVVASAALAGFLLLNWPPARIFMGDVGSTVAGLLFGFLTLKLANSLSQLAACAILLAGFITDASWTLLVRFLTGQRIWEAHRLHYYQKMARKAGSHKAPLATYALVGTLVQWPLAYGALHAPDGFWIIYLIAAITIHGALCWRYKAGVPAETRGQTPAAAKTELQ